MTNLIGERKERLKLWMETLPKKKR